MTLFENNKLKSFKDRIVSYVGDYSNDRWSIADNDVEQYCLDACYDIWNRVKQKNSNETQLFIKKSEGNTTWSEEEYREFVYAEQDGHLCRIEDAENEEYFSDGNSIHYASSKDPIVYFKNGALKYKPTALDSSTKFFYYIPEYQIDGFILAGENTAQKIEDFPGKYYDAVIWYACIEVTNRKLIQSTDAMNYTVAIDEDSEIAQIRALELNSLKDQLAIFQQRYENQFKNL